MNCTHRPFSSSRRGACRSVSSVASTVLAAAFMLAATGCAIGLEERAPDRTAPTTRDTAPSTANDPGDAPGQTPDLALVRGDDERVRDPDARRALPPDMSGMDSAVAVPDCAFVTFRYLASEGSEVLVTGDFVSWASLERHGALRLNEIAPGEFEITVELTAGRHEYKFIVDGSWHTDPENPTQVDDGFGGFNAVRQVCAELE